MTPKDLADHFERVKQTMRNAGLRESVINAAATLAETVAQGTPNDPALILEHIANALVRRQNSPTDPNALFVVPGDLGVRMLAAAFGTPFPQDRPQPERTNP